MSIPTYTTNHVEPKIEESIEFEFEDADIQTSEPVKKAASLDPVKDIAKVLGVKVLMGAWHTADFFAYYYTLLKNWYWR